MIIWIELQDGATKIYQNVNRIVERNNNVEIRSGAGLAEKILMIYKRAEIRKFGNSTILPRSEFKKVL
jgi:hypothetical protein